MNVGASVGADLRQKRFSVLGSHMMQAETRTYEKLDKEDLQELLVHAEEELGRFLSTNSGKYAVYQSQLVAICLCQGAAKHYVDSVTGVKDLDVWLFFEEHDTVKIPHRGNARKEIQANFKKLGPKRIDFMKKMIPLRFIVKNDAQKSLQNYLSLAVTSASAELSMKPVIGLSPSAIFGRVLWSPSGDSGAVTNTESP